MEKAPRRDFLPGAVFYMEGKLLSLPSGVDVQEWGTRLSDPVIQH